VNEVRTKPARLDPLGALACAAAAMLFACKGIFAKKLYALGVSVDAVVMIRGVIALPMFWILALRREPLREVLDTPWRAIAVAAFAGALCYYVGAMLDFVALSMIEASVERVLIFSYPAMVVLFTSVRDRRRPANRVLLAVGLTYVGIFFTVGGFDMAELRANLLGALLVIGSALSYAVYFIVSEKYTRAIGSARYTLFAMSAAPLCLLVHFGVQRDFVELTTISEPAWLLLFGIAVLCMFLPASLQAEGVRRIGAERGAVLSTVGPPTTVVFAWALLGERLNVWQFLGIALIVGGILALDLSQRRAPPQPEPAAP
jgi:drug/metabolite transporter (DMT)-like permease